MTIQSQLDQVLALVRGMPCGCMSVAQLGERDPGCDRCQIASKLSAIRAAAGWFTEAHGIALLAIKPGEVLTEEQWESVCAFVREQEAIIDVYKEREESSAVGGEAVPPVAWMDPRSGRTIHANEYSGVVKIGPLGDPGKLVPCREVYTAPLYASPPATVDVVAFDRLREKWISTTNNTFILRSDRDYIEGYDEALKTCAKELAALIGEKA